MVSLPNTPNQWAVAAPVFDHTGAVVGALGFSVPTVRMDEPRWRKLGERIAEAAWQVSKTLGATEQRVAQTRAAAEDVPAG